MDSDDKRSLWGRLRGWVGHWYDRMVLTWVDIVVLAGVFLVIKYL